MSGAKDRSPRLRKRRVKIVLETRDPDNARSLLEIVEEVFRPTDVEISVVDSSPGRPEEDIARRMGIEPLETVAHAAARKRLNDKDEIARAQPVSANVSPEAEMTRQRKWVQKARGFGWIVIRAAVEVAQVLG